MTTHRCALAALFALAACDADPVAPLTDAGTTPDDGGMTDGGGNADVRTADVLVSIDGPRGDGRLADMALADDMAIEPDGAPIDEIEPTAPNPDAPEVGQVGTATVAGQTYLLWADGSTVRSRVIGADGAFASEASDLALAAAPVTALAATAVTDIPWVAWSAGDGPIHLQTADVPLEAPIQLPLRGTPVLTAVGQSLLVAATDADGATAWVVVPRDARDADDLEPWVDLSGALPPVDGAAEVTDGVVLRLSSAGQCLYLAPGGESLSNFPCRIGPGAMVGDPSRVVLSFELNAGGIDRHTVLPLFGASREQRFHPMNAIPGEIPRLPVDGGHPIIGINLDAHAGEAQLAFVESDALWETAATWQVWPLPNARAAIRKGERGAIADFTDDEPRLLEGALVERDFGGRPYSFSPLEGCTPTFEVCDDADQDCDAIADNGVCCDLEPRFDGVEGGILELDPGALPQFLISDVAQQNGYVIIARTEEGFTPYRWLRDANSFEVQGSNPARFNGDWEPLTALTARGFTGFFGRDEDGAVAVEWRFPEGPLVGDTRAPEPHVVEGCADVLAARPLVHDNVVGDAEAGVIDVSPSALVVCPDRFIEVSAVTRSADEQLPIPGIPAGVELEWATIVHPSGSNRTAEVLVAYQHEGSRNLDLFRVLSGVDPAVGVLPLPSALDDLASADLEWPIYRSPDRTKAPVQILADQTARVRVRAGGTWRWQPILAADAPTRSAYAPTAHRVVTGQQQDDRSWAFWVTDVTGGDNGLDLWSTEPTTVIDARPMGGVPQLDWRVTLGAFPDDFLVVLRRVEGNDDWRLTIPKIRCRAP